MMNGVPGSPHIPRQSCIERMRARGRGFCPASSPTARNPLPPNTEGDGAHEGRATSLRPCTNPNLHPRPNPTARSAECVLSEASGGCHQPSRSQSVRYRASCGPACGLVGGVCAGGLTRARSGGEETSAGE
ncbi:hypothetical protein C8Q77DRAFT_125077 [Trametes polyzona]|nr:hypothetical protein C8Q77DRAFT_125077 [Trametes polyzona]